MRNWRFIMLIVFAFIACSDDKGSINREIYDKDKNISDVELVTELLNKTDGDKEQLGRILNCSTYTIERIENNDTYLTDTSRKEFVSLFFDLESNRMETIIEKDPYYDSWTRSLRHTLNTWFQIIFISLIVNLILSFFIKEFIFLLVFELILVGTVYFITWIGNILSPYENPAFLFIEKINSVIEIVI